MNKDIKVGLRLKLDFWRDIWTVDYYIFSHSREIAHDYTSYSYMFLFLGIVVKVKN